jgi:hypothetical protein
VSEQADTAHVVTDADWRLAEILTGAWAGTSWWEAAEERLSDVIRYCRTQTAGGGDAGPVVAAEVLALLGLTAGQITAAGNR